MPALIGVFVMGFRVTDAIQTVQVARDTARMFARGIDFSVTANQDLIVRLSSELGMTRTAGDGVVIISKVLYIGHDQCAAGGLSDDSCTNINLPVFTLNANFPANLYGATNITFNTTVTEEASRRRLVAMNASVDAPLYFLRVLRRDYTNVRVSAVAARRDVNLILLLDRSGSIAQANAEDALRGSAKVFVDKFAEDRDRLGMISFSGNYYIDFPYGMDFKTRTPTNLSQAIDEEGALNVVVFFTDGRPTAITGDFPKKTVANDQRYGDGSSTYPNTGSLYTYRVSSCSSSTPKFGFVSAPGTYATTGITWGVMLGQAASRPDADSDELVVAPNSSGCSYASGSGLSYLQRMRRDIAYIPDTVTYDGTVISTSGYMSSLDKFPTGHSYAGRIRPDSPRAVRYVANNVADNIAAIMRNNTRLKPTVFSIGLGGTSTEGVDHEFLRRLANDPSRPIYDSSKPVGLYVYAPTPAQLSEAFARIPSEILRLSQ